MKIETLNTAMAINAPFFSCTWKGQDCLDSVHETLTDMGVCYTFRHDDMFIEQSGIDPIRFKDPFDEA